MILCIPSTTFAYLPDFVPLIQLLVGSVFVASYFSSTQSTFSDVIDKIRDILNATVDINEYKVIETDEEKTLEMTCPNGSVCQLKKKEKINPNAIRLNTDYTTIKKSIMLIMAMYGAFALFYCAEFEPQLCSNPTDSPSPLGLIALSLFVTLFTILSCCIFGRRQPQKYFVIIFAVLMSAIFIVFFIIIPNFQPFPSSWEYDLHLIANVWTLINLGALWLIILLKKRFLPVILQHKANEFNLRLNLASIPNVIERIGRITKETSNYKLIFRLALFLKAVRTLRRDCLYFNYDINGNTQNPIENYSFKLLYTIYHSHFNRFTKWLLRLLIIKHPRANTVKVAPNNSNYIDLERENITNLCIKRFINTGIIVKRTVYSPS